MQLSDTDIINDNEEHTGSLFQLFPDFVADLVSLTHQL
jgi:hypothetical protein